LLDAYLDIETTGLSSTYSYITVIGIYLDDGRDSQLVQLVGDTVCAPNLRAALGDVQTIFTYNGSRFDLPFIKDQLKTDLESSHRHRDLMYDCWRCNLRGGFKAVERQLGISRELTGISGFDAIRLWRLYREGDNQEALRTLLRYNEEDVVNLKTLRHHLEGPRWRSGR
jgi:uncharacterized protein YprB with RNaseH-like and TPR domain